MTTTLPVFATIAQRRAALRRLAQQVVDAEQANVPVLGSGDPDPAAKIAPGTPSLAAEIAENDVAKALAGLVAS